MVKEGHHHPESLNYPRNRLDLSPNYFKVAPQGTVLFCLYVNNSLSLLRLTRLSDARHNRIFVLRNILGPP